MRKLYNTKALLIAIFLTPVIVVFLSVIPRISAQPYGVGAYGANVPYGGQTSLTIATDGNVSMRVDPSGSGETSGASAVTVTSTDVVGYKLYIRAQSSTNLTGSNGTIPASGNGSPGALSVNTWGYNTDGSSNYVGITLSDVLIRTGTGPYTSGDVTNVHYGVKVDYATPAGSYSDTIVYTAVPQTT